MLGRGTRLAEIAFLAKVEMGIIEISTFKARSCWFPDSGSFYLKVG